MNRRRKLIAVAVTLCALAGLAWAYLQWSARDPLAARGEMLGLLPGDPSAVGFVYLAQLRTSPFLAELFAWAPEAKPDADYTQFVQATGFHYEKDLDRAAIGVMRQGNAATYALIADGRFDRKKIEAYAARSGRKENVLGRTIFALNVGNGSPTSFFTFLRDDRIAWTNDASYAAILLQRTAAASPAEWREHFVRLAGTPVFGVSRQDGGSLVPLPPMPGGLQSPQLAGLLGNCSGFRLRE